MRYHAIMQTNGQVWITHASFPTVEGAMEYVRTGVEGWDLVGVVGAESESASQLLKGAWIRPSE